MHPRQGRSPHVRFGIDLFYHYHRREEMCTTMNKQGISLARYTQSPSAITHNAANILSPQWHILFPPAARYDCHPPASPSSSSRPRFVPELSHVLGRSESAVPPMELRGELWL